MFVSLDHLAPKILLGSSLRFPDANHLAVQILWKWWPQGSLTMTAAVLLPCKLSRQMEQHSLQESIHFTTAQLFLYDAVMMPLDTHTVHSWGNRWIAREASNPNFQQCGALSICAKEDGCVWTCCVSPSFWLKKILVKMILDKPHQTSS